MYAQPKFTHRPAGELYSLKATVSQRNNDRARIVSIDQTQPTNQVPEPSVAVADRSGDAFFPRYLGVHSHFVERVIHLIESNLSDENYGILQLCQDAGTSRSQLHNKLKQLTGFSTSIFIRMVRLRKAQVLLRMTDLNITQVAFEVGFDDAQYFSRVFSQMFRQSPKAFRKHAVALSQ